MPDDSSQTLPESDDASKAETIRITLPPKQEQPVAKRETVRINLPGRPVPPSGITPKKETTKLSSTAIGVAPQAAPPSAPSAPARPAPPAAPSGIAKAPPSAPSAPMPPRPTTSPGGLSVAPTVPAAPKSAMPSPPKPIAPPSAPSSANVPSAPVKPLSGGPPKPPSMAAKPGAPLKPAPVTGASGIAPAPILQKSAAPKKETARITLPPEGSAKAALPKATIKMGQTQPLASRPAPSAGGVAVAPPPAPAMVRGAAAPDGAVNAMSMVALLFSAAALIVVYLVYQAVGA